MGSTAKATNHTHENSMPNPRVRWLTAVLALLSTSCLYWADIEIISPNATIELQRISSGLMNPSVISWSTLANAIGQTVSFALQGMLLAVVAGFGLSLAYRWRLVRLACAFVRSIHELFWALIFLQLFALSSTTGILALAIPYAGTLAKVYGEIFEETHALAATSLLNPKSLSAFAFTTLPQAWSRLCEYSYYRLECAVRSSIILGFIGLPTLGFYLETAWREGDYHTGAAYLYALLFLIVTLRFWARATLLPVVVIASFYFLPLSINTSWHTLEVFITNDIIPAPLRTADWAGLGAWFWPLWESQLLPGLANTLILSQAALVPTALLALIAFPLNAAVFHKDKHNRVTGLHKYRKALGNGLLIVGRTLPEYLLAFIGLLIVGPSMLPAIVALALHNGAILAHLLARFSDTLTVRANHSRGINLYSFEVLPRLFRPFLALLLYRWEVIVRESAILGILGIATLGFYVDSAFEEFRFDRAALLIVVSALLNMAIDQLSRTLRLAFTTDSQLSIR